MMTLCSGSVTLTAQERLDDLAVIESADPGGVLGQVDSSAAQLRAAARTAAETDLGPALSGRQPRRIVVTGMGGSGVAGEVLSAVCGPSSATQVVALHDYRLPGWVGREDLVIAVSCSGTTEETLSTAGEAARPGLSAGRGGQRRVTAGAAGRAGRGRVHPGSARRNAALHVLGPVRAADGHRGSSRGDRDPRARARGRRRRTGADLPAVPPRPRILRQPGQDAGP